MPFPAALPSGPLSRRFDVSTVRETPVTVGVETTEAERAALARDCGLAAIAALEAELVVARDHADGVAVTGSVRARIRQVCVVSLDEFDGTLDEPVDVSYVPEARLETMVAERAARSVNGEDDEEDLPDVILGGRIDLGAVVAETFVLGLDPYPKKPGAVFEPMPESDGPEASPFAVLRGIKGTG